MNNHDFNIDQNNRDSDFSHNRAALVDGDSGPLAALVSARGALTFLAVLFANAGSKHYLNTGIARVGVDLDLLPRVPLKGPSSEWPLAISMRGSN